LGKSGALHAAGSVWGNPAGTVNSWRATDNSLESLAAQFNDGLLILDELKEVDPRQAGAIAYMLANQRGKNRAHHAGGLREVTTWRIIMLSSGEIGLADHMASANIKTHAGQAVRFIELPADAGTGGGMWSNFHHLPDGRAFTDHLKVSAAKLHGTAGRAFIAALIENMGEVPATVAKLEKSFYRDFVPENAASQVKRVASAFALVAAAGEFSAEWGICPWPRREAYDAAGTMFQAWLGTRQTSGNAEEAQILSHVRLIMEQSWQSKFTDWNRASEEGSDLSRMPAIINPLGFRKKETPFNPDAPEYRFYVSCGQFAAVFCQPIGFTKQRVAAVLKARSILRCDADASTYRETLPNGDARSYCIKGKELWAQT